MNLFAISGILLAVTNSVMVILMFARGRQKIHYIWGFFCLSAFMWGFGGYKIAVTADPAQADFWWRMTHVGVIFIPVLFTHFVYEFLKLKRKWVIYLIYTLGFSFLATNFIDGLFIANMRWVFNQFYYDSPPGIFYIPFTAMFFILVIHSLVELWLAFKKSTGITRVQIKYFFVGMAVSFAGGGLSFLPVYKIDLYPVFNLTAFLFTIIVAYVILRYRFMDIRIIARKMFLYIGAAIFVYGIFYLVVWFYNHYLGGIYSQTAYAVGILVAIAFVAGFNFTSQWLKKIANKYFFVSLYNYQETINKLSQELNYYTDLNKIINAIVSTIKKAMQLDRAGVLLVNTDVKPIHYQIAKVVGFNKQNGISLVQDNFLTRHLKKTQKPLVRDELKLLARDTKNKKDSKGFTKLRDHMEHIEASLCLPLMSSGKLIGIVVLGSKISKDAYSNEDLELLTTLANQAGTAIDNARLYQEINEFNTTLKRKVDEQTKDLKNKNIHLQKLLEMRSEFLDIASHQLKTPVSVIKGTISMFKEGSIDKLNQKQKMKFIDNIQHKASKLSSIINDILRASEMDTDEFKLSKKALKPYQAEEIIKSAYNELKNEAEEKGLALKLKIPRKKTSQIMTDEDLLEQAVYNLVDNAIKYTAKGFVKISLSEENKRIIIKIADSGIGIPKIDQPKMFGKFARAKNAVNMYTDGSGLGIFIVKKIVEAHKDGQISFESEEGKGTTFTISLPIYKHKQIKK